MINYKSRDIIVTKPSESYYSGSSSIGKPVTSLDDGKLSFKMSVQKLALVGDRD